ncbi:MAG: zinc ABC transporter substrate-binding protein [Geminicoccaceae bacterium]
MAAGIHGPRCRGGRFGGGEALKAVTTFTVLADMAQNTSPTTASRLRHQAEAEIHGYEPTPQDIVRAHDADLILWNGFGLERWISSSSWPISAMCQPSS